MDSRDRKLMLLKRQSLFLLLLFVIIYALYRYV